MSGSEQGERPSEIVSARCDGSDPEKAGELGARDTSSSNDCESRRSNGAEYYGDESFFRLAGFVFRFTACAGPDFQDFRRRDPFGIWQVGGRYECPSQWDRKENAEYPPAQANKKRLPEGEFSPPSNNDESGKNKDDRRKCAGRGRNCLD